MLGLDARALLLRLPGFDSHGDELILHRVRVGDARQAIRVVRGEMRQAPLAEAANRELRQVRLVRAHAPLQDDPDRVAGARHRADSLAAAQAVADNLEPLA